MEITFASNDYCFCTLALGYKYQLMAKELAQDLKKYAPEVKLVVGTDQPDNLKDCDNIIGFKLDKTGILHCFNDKRFVILEGLNHFSAVIYVDADTRIINNIPHPIQFAPGITGHYKNLLTHVNKYRPENLESIKRVATKLNIPIEEANWIGESLFVVVKDEGKEKEFIKIWGLIAQYLELKGIHSGEGNTMGLAANKVGWQVRRNNTLMAIDKVRKHLDASSTTKQTSLWESLKKRLIYHYRLNKGRIIALKNFDFFYR